jgi:uncharacterized membrane protein
MKNILTTLIIITLLFLSCGALHKKQSLQQSTQNLEILAIESQDSYQSQELSQWLQSWIEQLQYSNTLIHSDSIISYLPDGGFQLSKGTIIHSELKQNTSSSQTAISNKEQESKHRHQQQEQSFQQEQSNQQHEKDRSPTIPLKWLVLLTFIAILSPLLLAYLNKRNKI